MRILRAGSLVRKNIIVTFSEILFFYGGLPTMFYFNTEGHFHISIYLDTYHVIYQTGHFETSEAYVGLYQTSVMQPFYENN